MLRTALLIAAATLAFSSGAVADICKYIDDDGNLHFTNVAPENGWRKIERIGRPQF